MEPVHDFCVFARSHDKQSKSPYLIKSRNNLVNVKESHKQIQLRLNI